ncbi:Rv3235 family protein [Streptomyces sp. NBC_00557]|uniref:Rv3235 family protein n=1 Tax=Streptomyces sp. NBC_00557 TaxID=2975776 RepID=UPI002E806C27|nr:Rv3235 family protein [Streptomyces sp. NBC_00557]WUC36622.1 Rv3235 family protein [Streptomyces sp. NBC_00557]
MNKVMSRTMPRAASRTPQPRHRPPTRHDTRRPGGTPPRKPPVRNKQETPPPAPADVSAVRTAPRAVLPPPRPTDLFADRLLAVLSGQRPVHWMLRHTAGRAYDDLARLAERSPLRTRGALPVVRDIGYYVAGEGTLEVFARVAAGDRLRALAFRLERGRDLRWRCTAVETGSRP